MSADFSHLLSLIGLTFMLGLRHGMDPDHLAMVDNLTRYNAQAAPRVARWCGAWFSLGHGVLVMVGAYAMLHGNAHGHELPQAMSAVGLLLASGLLVIGGSVLGRVGPSLALKVSGAAIAATGVMLVAAA